ncbi:MAG: hypothetical protein DHS20C15_31750 [Planctomycetota bacterium]|nr:MAG: hypothetical protein DHS20C15_31750 [Planctomycetota bacterium]
MRSLSCLLVLLGVATALQAQPILYVDDSAPGANNGTSWTNAYTDLRVALQNAPDNALVRVAQGTYLPDSGTGLRGLSFAIGSDITSLLGGFAGFGTPFPNTRNSDNFPTILSGDLLGDDLPGFVHRSDNSYHVVRTTDSSLEFVFAGFTVRGGNADGTGVDAEGGGAHMFGQITVRNCTFSDSRADVAGGGARLGVTRIDDCRFLGNQVGAADLTGSARGAGLSGRADQILDCVFEDNTSDAAGITSGVGFAGHGDSANETLVRGCVFRGNTSTGRTLGVGVEASSQQESVTFSECTFEANSSSGADSQGGGARSNGCVIFEHCTFLENTLSGAGSRGGGVFADGLGPETPRLEHSVIAGNHSVLEGGGLATSKDVIIDGCSVIGNSSDASDGGGVHAPGDPALGHAALRSTILWANTTSGLVPDGADQLASPVGPVAVSGCDIQNYAGVPVGTDVIALDPLFVDIDGADDVLGNADDDLHLLANSPCIDSGSAFSDLDPDGTPADIGAFFFDQGEPPPPLWADLGFALAGTPGAPALVGAGTQLPGEVVTLALSDALPVTLSSLVAGFDELGVFFKGGTMVPTVDFLLLRATNGFGEVEVSFPWPAGVPTGFETYWQFWVQDPGAPVGWSASNGLRGVSP